MREGLTIVSAPREALLRRVDSLRDLGFASTLAGFFFGFVGGRMVGRTLAV